MTRPACCSDQFVELQLQRDAVPVLGALDQEDHQNVMMVVPVFTANCQVLLNPNIGLVIAQGRRKRAMAAKVTGCHSVRESHVAKRLK